MPGIPWPAPSPWTAGGWSAPVLVTSRFNCAPSCWTLTRTAAEFNDLKARGVAPLEVNARFLAERPDLPDLRNELRAILR